ATKGIAANRGKCEEEIRNSNGKGSDMENLDEKWGEIRIEDIMTRKHEEGNEMWSENFGMA
ncbi:hypothetical protein, partial [Bacillus altitudinis]|uniref:hypothetical protein n=1 Tax=Bacillus altitudinis TaxID=293387 RepID=UPI001643D08C